MITRLQLKAARALMEIDQETLARHADVSPDTIAKFESGQTLRLHPKTEAAITSILSRRVELTDQQGVRMKDKEVEIFQGPERFHDFTEEIYQHLLEKGGEVCLSAVDETLFAKLRKDPEGHRRRMADLVAKNHVTVRVLATKSRFAASWASYRWQPSSEYAAPTAFYVFGERLALVSFAHDPAPYVVVHRSGPFAAAYKEAFEAAWSKGLSPKGHESA